MKQQQIFSCVDYYHVIEGQLDSRAKRVFCWVQGWCEGFRIYSLSGGRIIFSRDVTFNESTMYSKKNTKTSNLRRIAENLLETDRLLEVHQPTIVDLPRVNLLMMMLRFQCQVILNLRLLLLFLNLGWRWSDLIRGHLVDLTLFFRCLNKLSRSLLG